MSGFPDVFPPLSTDYWRLVRERPGLGRGLRGHRRPRRRPRRRDRDRLHGRKRAAAARRLAVGRQPSPTGRPSPSRCRASTRPASASPSPAVGARRVLRQPPGARRRGRQRHASWAPAAGSRRSRRRCPAPPRPRSSPCAPTGPIPTVCQLPAPATPAPPAAACRTGRPRARAPRHRSRPRRPASADRIAPSSHFTAPLAFAKVKIGQAPRRRRRAGPLRHRERELRARAPRRHALQLPQGERDARRRDLVREADLASGDRHGPSGT